MGFRLVPRSMTLYDLELNGVRPPLLSNTYTGITPAVYNIKYDVVSRVGFPAELIFPP